MGSLRSLLAVHAHPDDETITMGGTLAHYAAAGVRTIVVTCTRGDLGTVFDPELVGQDVGAMRAGELECATRTLGVSRVVQLGYGDSGMAGTLENDRAEAFCRADRDQVVARLVAIMVEERPSVMVAYDETGGYGHPDHIRAHQVGLAAYRAAPADLRPERLYFVRFPRTWAGEFARTLRAAGIDAPASAATGADAGPSVTEIGVDDALATTTVDVRAFVEVKRAAVACHRSQMPATHFLRRMPSELAKRLWAREFYSLEAGAPVRDGLFET